MTHRPRIFTFYSCRGGAGRSMALLNVAWTLQSMGRHVLIVDLDLEAPGVSGFLSRNEELAPHPADQPDIVDLLRKVLPLAHRQPGDASRRELPPLGTYLREVKPEKFARAQNPRFRRTRLDVLGAGDERDCTNRLAAFDIASLTAGDLAGAGDVLREIFFSHRFPWAWQTGNDDQPTPYDYILIDSRSGFTGTGSLCTGPLADRLVIFCGLNNQNINGTAAFLKAAGLQSGPSSAAGNDAPGSGVRPCLLVASPVPAGDMEKKEERFQEMERILNLRPDHSISYHSRLSFFETIFLRDFPREAITREYRDLTESILSLGKDHPRQHQERIQPLQTPHGDPQVTDRLSLLQYAAMLDEREAAQLAEPMRHAADHLADQAAALTDREAAALFTSACDSYRAVLAVKPDDHWAWNNWGLALAHQAKQKTRGEADALYAAAGEKYQAALALKPDSHEVLYNWGSALADQAQQKTGERADALFAAAGEKYQAALAIKPDDHDALNNWGSALADQAKQKAEARAGALFAAAAQKYEAALAIKPGDHDVLYNLACLASLQKNSRAALKWLKKARHAGYSFTRDELTGDTNFDPVRRTPGFADFLATLRA